MFLKNAIVDKTTDNHVTCSSNKKMLTLYEGCPENNAPCFFRSKYLLKNHENNTYPSGNIFLQTLFFHKFCIHFYSLAAKRYECMYVV
jgi:hypothetical protein